MINSTMRIGLNTTSAARLSGIQSGMSLSLRTRVQLREAPRNVVDRGHRDSDSGALGGQGAPDGVDLAGKGRPERDDGDAIGRPSAQPRYDCDAQTGGDHCQLGL